ncbi:uncharacterized protein METZ01_LOCUS224435, partial [marine metagenome]
MDAHHLVEVKKNPNIPEFRAGDTVQVNYRVTEGERSRIQPFIGVVIRRTGGTSPAACFTVRHILRGFGVERTFPIYSPHLDSVLIQRYGKVRRAKLFYLRERSGRAARVKELTTVPAWRKASPTLAPLEEIVETEEAPEEAAVETEETAEEAVVDTVETEEAPEEAVVDTVETEEAPEEAAVDAVETEEAPEEVVVDTVETEEAPEETAVDAVETEEAP